MNLLPRSFGLSLLGLAFSLPLFAQNTRPAETPKLLQVDVAPNNTGLPNEGLAYCGPTSMTMNLFWLRNQGFPTVAPEFNQKNAYSLDRVIAGLADTSPFGGTLVPPLEAGTRLYLSLQGFSENIQSSIIGRPNFTDFNNNFVGNTMITTLIGWFDWNGTGYTRTGGHFVSLLDFDSFSQTATINNPAPNSLFATPVTPSAVQQQPRVAVTPRFDNTLQYITPIYTGAPKKDIALIEAMLLINVTALPGTPPAPFEFNNLLEINTNGGDMTAFAPLRGQGGIFKIGKGELALAAENRTRGQNIAAGGTLGSVYTPPDENPITPFGNGTILLTQGGTLALEPAPSKRPNPRLFLASGHNDRLEVKQGATLVLKRGQNDTLKVRIGGHRKFRHQNLFLHENSTLMIRTSNRLSELGDNLRLVCDGLPGNRPPLAHGLVTPAIVASTDDAPRDGAFLTYRANTGFTEAPILQQASFKGTDDTTALATTGDIRLATKDAHVAALVANDRIHGSSGSTLNITPENQSRAGLILNGGRIDGATLNFGRRDAYIYANNRGGRIDSNLIAQGNVITFGPGSTTLSGKKSAIDGTVHVNSGRLFVTRGGAGKAPIHVHSGANFLVGRKADIKGKVTIDAGGTATLKGGAIEGRLTLPAGATLRGTGTVRYKYDLLLEGNLGDGFGAGVITFQAEDDKLLEIDGETSIFNWNLNALHDGPQKAGKFWGQLRFQSRAIIGSAAAPLPLNLSFSEGLEPKVENPFWRQPRSWVLFEFAAADNPEPFINSPNNTFRHTVGVFSTEYTGKQLILNWTPLAD